jgi:hypothetical protein
MKHQFSDDSQSHNDTLDDDTVMEALEKVNIELEMQESAI